MKSPIPNLAVCVALLCAAGHQALAAPAQAIQPFVQKEYASLFELYKHLHQHPELSFQEEKTSARVAEELRSAGFEVATGIGKFGVVGVLRNGSGRTVLIRTDMAALPVKEQTGLPYASPATGT